MLQEEGEEAKKAEEIIECFDIVRIYTGHLLQKTCCWQFHKSTNKFYPSLKIIVNWPIGYRVLGFFGVFLLLFFGFLVFFPTADLVVNLFLLAFLQSKSRRQIYLFICNFHSHLLPKKGIRSL